jgi:hypothetical protein
MGPRHLARILALNPRPRDDGGVFEAGGLAKATSIITVWRRP